MGRGDVRGIGEMYSGKMHERDVFGVFKSSPEFIAAYRKKATESGYVPREAALELIRLHGKENPLNPKKPFAHELRQQVIELLDLQTNEEMDRVKFYSAVETAADVFHGIDGWIEYESLKRGRIVVTIDVTKNPNKDAWKADVIIPEVVDPEEDEEKFLEGVEAAAEEIVSLIEEALRQKAA